MPTPALNRRAAPAPRGKMGLRADFKPGDFEVAIEQMGYRLLWEQAARCPCRNNAETGQPHVNCPVCFKRGWEYHTALPIRGIVDDLSRKAEGWIAYGDYVSGMAQITVRPEHRPGRWHRFTLLDSVMEHSERVERQAGSVDRLTYPVASVTRKLLVRNAAGEEVLRTITDRVLRLRLMDQTTLLPGDLLSEGEHFAVTDSGRIDWTLGDNLGAAPAEGQGYAVTYYFHPRYVVLEHPHGIRDTQIAFKQPGGQAHTELPVTVMAKLDFLTGAS